MSDIEPEATGVAFQGHRCIARGPVSEIAAAVRLALAQAGEPVLVFDAETGAVVEIGPEGAPPPPRRPGRPKLGVTAREVTLLPRHWEWLNRQPGGASVALRRLVEEARRRHQGADRVRVSQEAAYRFMSAMAGNLPSYEEAIRALFRADQARFEEMAARWPQDIRDLSFSLAADAFGESG
jgi:hypothetical protein